MAYSEPTTIVFSGSKEKMGETLGGLRNFVTEASRQAGVATSAMHRLRLAVDEIATNIIVHGYEGEPGDIKISSAVDDDSLTITLEDTGTPFDPSQAAMPDNLDDPLEERDIGGLGIYLAITGVDDFRYERVDNRNRNHFTMRRATSENQE